MLYGEAVVGDCLPCGSMGLATGDRRHMVDGRGGAATARWTRAVPPRIKSSNKSPFMIEVPPVRIPEAPGAVVPHAGICEGSVGQPTSLL